VSSAGVPEESSRRSVQQLENSVGRAQFWCEEPACRGVQQIPDKQWNVFSMNFIAVNCMNWIELSYLYFSWAPVSAVLYTAFVSCRHIRCTVIMLCYVLLFCVTNIFDFIWTVFCNMHSSSSIPRKMRRRIQCILPRQYTVRTTHKMCMCRYRNINDIKHYTLWSIKKVIT